MNIVLDTHSHTTASGHAYSTMKEMIDHARNMGLEALALTEHGPKMLGSVDLYYFMNLYVVPRKIKGVQVFLGAELNILDETGRVDLPYSVYEKLDINIASIHFPQGCYGESRGIVKNTQAYLNVMKKDGINIIGHPDDSRFPIDYDTLVAAAKEHHVLLELNNSSLNPKGYRVDAIENQIKILELCKKYKTSISLGSDAHVEYDLGNFNYVMPVLEMCNFPEELVVNTSVDRLREYVNYKEIPVEI